MDRLQILGERRDGAKVLYILGAGHSGSSLADVLLGGHPQIVSTGEVHRLSISPDDRECGCGASISACQFWSDALQNMNSLNPGLNLKSWTDFRVSAFDGRSTKWGERLDEFVSRAVLATGSRVLVETISKFSDSLQREREAARNSWSLFDVLCASLSVDFVVDSTKTPARFSALQSIRHEDLYVLHVVRDGRAVAASEIRRKGVTSKVAAKNWQRANRNAQLVIRGVPPARRRQMRYEDFCEDPEGTLAILFNWLGLEPHPELQLPDTGGYHTIPGNPMLLTGISEIRLDEKWRTQLTEEQISIINKVVRAGLSKHGYV